MGHQSRFANLQEFAPDRERSMNGARLDLGGGRVLIVRQAGGFNRRFEHLTAMRARQRGMVDVTDELEQRLTADEIAIQVAAECLIAGWEGLCDDAGEPVPCTPEATLELLQEHPELAERVVVFAYHEENFRRRADTKSD